MSSSHKLLYFPKNSIIQGKPRVYMCYADSDFENAFMHNAKLMIEACPNAIMYYRDPNAVDAEKDEEFYNKLSEMHLFVILVTRNLLQNENHITDEIAFARRMGIPILPLMQEGLTEDQFEKLIPGIHCLNENKVEVSAISFMDKLKAFTNRLLIGEEFAEKIRAEFAAYIFVSYRKKDREYAKKVMKQIHKFDCCRDLAIWYDEFLVPGEDYNQAIIDAMKKSSIFAMVVTPNLLEDQNYVMKYEYPDACEMDIERLPVEAVCTDRMELADKYKDLPTVVSVEDHEKLEAALQEAISRKVTGDRLNDANHLYLIGFAYLNGFDMEKDVVKGLDLIARAAEFGLHDAYEKLVSYNRFFCGGEKGIISAARWQKLYMELLQKELSETLNEEKLMHYLDQLILQGDIYMDGKKMIGSKPIITPKLNDGNDELRIEENQKKKREEEERWLNAAWSCYKRALNNLSSVAAVDEDLYLRYSSKVNSKIAFLCQSDFNYKMAKKYSTQAVRASKKLREKTPSKEHTMEYAYHLYEHGTLDQAKWNYAMLMKQPRNEEDLNEAILCFEKAWVLYDGIMENDDSVEVKKAKYHIDVSLCTAYKMLDVEDDRFMYMSDEAMKLAESIYMQTKLLTDYDKIGTVHAMMADSRLFTKKDQIEHLEQAIRISEEITRQNKSMFNQMQLFALKGKLEQLKN